MNKIGGSARVRDELTNALAQGRGVTAKVRWVSRVDEDGRNRWIHCTPLIGTNGQIGVWMVLIVDDDSDGLSRRWKQAPPVDPRFSRVYRAPKAKMELERRAESSPAEENRLNGEYFSDGGGVGQARSTGGRRGGGLDELEREEGGSPRSGSPYSFSAD